MQRPRPAPRLRRPMPDWMRNAPLVPEVSPAPASAFQPSPPVGTGLYGVDATGQTWQYVPPEVIPLAPPGGPFLPLSGGTVTGPLNVTATGTTTSRSVQDRFAEQFNVKDFGAQGNGTTDDTAAIRAAAAALTVAGGGTLYFPAATYLVSDGTLIPSNTRVAGDGPASRLLAADVWLGTQLGGFFYNQNWTNTVLTDHDIIIENLQFDFGNTGTLPGGGHQLSFSFASNVIVRDCTFECRDHADAVALVGCYNTLIDGCSAFDFNNCGYDHWWGPAQGRVTNCYGRTASSVQMVNWNPEPSDGIGTGQAADGFIMTGCTMVATGANAIPMQLEPLSATTTVRDVVVQGNTFINVSLAMRGAITGMVVANNIFDSVAGGAAAIDCYPQFGGNPADIVISGNVALNPGTTSGNVAVFVVDTSSAVVIGNAVIGATIASLDTGTYTPVVNGNYFSNGLVNSLTSVGQSPPLNGSFSQVHAISGVVGSPGQGAWLAWNQDNASGRAYLLNQRGGGPGGIVLGEMDASANVTPQVTIDAGGNLNAVGFLASSYNASNVPPPPQSGVALTWNYSGGGAETDLWNTYTGGVPTDSFIFYQRTTAGATRLVDITPQGHLYAYGNIRTGGPSGPIWLGGTGSPGSLVAPPGSLYSRTDGSVGDTLYVSAGGGVWNPVAGV